MTAELQSAVIAPPAPTEAPLAAAFDLASSAAAIGEAARQDPASALALLNETAIRYALVLLAPSWPGGVAFDGIGFSGWSRPDPVGARDDQSLVVLPPGNGLAGRQSFWTSNTSGGAILLIAEDQDRSGAGHLFQLSVGPHLHTDKAIFDRHGFRQRWIEIGEPLFVEPVAAFPAVRLQAVLRKVALAEEMLHAALDLGILEGFWEAARSHVTTRSRPWQGQSLTKATDDPHLLRRYGEYTATLHAAQGLVAEAVAAAVSDAAALPSTIDTVSAARAFALLAGRSLVSGTIELLGAGATSERYGFDLFWRDFTAHAVAHPPLWPVESIGRRLTLSGIEEILA